VITRSPLQRLASPATALLPLRFFFGATFLWAGLDKLLDQLMHLLSVIDAQRVAIGAQYSKRLGKPDFCPCFPQDPVDYGLFRSSGRSDTGCVFL